MKPINLTKALRNQIVDGLVIKAANVEQSKINKIRAKLAEDFWNEWDVQWMEIATVSREQMKAMLENSLIDKVSSSNIRVNVEYDYNLQPALNAVLPVYISHNLVRVDVVSGTVHPGFHWKQFKPSDSLIKQATHLLERAVTLAVQSKDLRKDLENLAASCRTSKQLLEVLPQAKEFLPVGSPTNGLISTKLIEDVQAKLKTGVPALNQLQI